MATFETFLSSFDPDTKGQQFEHFVKWFLLNDPEWSTQVDEIWLWDEYPGRWGRDCGIDLVFKHQNGEMWAVQAKCYAPEYSITKSDVDTFLSESNRPGIDKRLLIATTDRIGLNARQVCKAQEKSVTLFLYSAFEQAAIEYPDHISGIHSARRKQRPDPRPHQLKAIDAVEAAFQDADRGQLIMACGTGKTYTTFWVKERLLSQSTLVLLPSLSLLSQTLREWTFASHTAFHVLCVCSDETVGKKSSQDAIINTVQDVSFPTSSDAREVRAFLKGDGDKVIFSTYHSSPVIAEAQMDDEIPMFDLVIADEAHRCTGETGKAFTTVLDQSQIRAKKRLFATATPRTYSSNLKKNASERGVDVTGMDDEAVFGTVFHALTFGQAIEADLLTDYQVVIVGVDQPMIAQWIENRELLQTDSGKATDANALASQIGLIKAIKDYDLKRMISFHSRIKGAEKFATEMHDAIDFMSEEHRPDGIIWTGFVSGKMSAHERRLKLDQLKGLTSGDRGLLSNARCLSEGVDVPSLDGVAFIDPKSSQVDIVQAVGRAIRLSEDKTVGTIVLPVFIEDGDDAESSIQSSHFKPVWDVLNALKSHDEVLSFELDKYRTNLGRKGGVSDTVGGVPKVIIDLPLTVDASFADSLRTCLVEKTTSSWNFWFGLLETFVKEKGSAKIPYSYKTEVGYSLGGWARNQRSRKDQLTPEQVSKLESLAGWVWDPLEAAWEEGFSYLVKYVEQENDSRVPRKHKTESGYKLGNWVNTQRSNRERITPEREARLESLAGWVWDFLEEAWEEGFSYLVKYVEQEGHARVARSYKTEDGYRLGQWVGMQRNRKYKLTPEREARLELLAFDWDPLNTAWEEGFSYLSKYVEQKGHAWVPRYYNTEDGYNLAVWTRKQRRNKDNLTPEQASRLELLGFDWSPMKRAWEDGFSYLIKYVEREGHARVPRSYKTEDGYRLGQWVGVQRSSKDKLPTERASRLESLDGWTWDTLKEAWETGYSYLIKYVERQGHSRVPKSYKTESAYKLGIWVNTQRSNRERITPERASKLEGIDGWVWDTLDAAWEAGFSHLVEYVEKEGHARVPAQYKTEDGYRLGQWVGVQRSSRDKLISERVLRLESLNGWVWDVLKLAWEVGFSHLVKYVEKQGHARVPASYKTEGGYRLGQWVGEQRSKRDKLTSEQKARLESLDGWVWNAR